MEIDFVTDAIKNGCGENCYHYINKFEEEFSSYLGVKHTIATSSCTGALHMGLYALGIGPGDEVIIANTNWVASAAPIIHLGATPTLLISTHLLGAWLVILLTAIILRPSNYCGSFIWKSL